MGSAYLRRSTSCVVTVAVENSVTVMYEANRRRCSQDSVGAIVDLVVGVTNTER